MAATDLTDPAPLDPDSDFVFVGDGDDTGARAVAVDPFPGTTNTITSLIRADRDRRNRPAYCVICRERASNTVEIATPLASDRGFCRQCLDRGREAAIERRRADLDALRHRVGTAESDQVSRLLNLVADEIDDRGSAVFTGLLRRAARLIVEGRPAGVGDDGELICLWPPCGEPLEGRQTAYCCQAHGRRHRREVDRAVREAVVDDWADSRRTLPSKRDVAWNDPTGDAAVRDLDRRGR
jgi:hypothetical protein